MDIYKFSDEIPGGKRSRRADKVFCRKTLTNNHKCDTLETEALESVGVSDVITDLKQGVKNPNRVNIYVNNAYAFSLDIAQVVDFKIKKGLEISREQLEEFKKASEMGKLYQRALEWVLMRPHSEKETRDYLYKKVYEKKLDKEYIDKIIQKLADKKYLDDRRFAEYYVENRFVKKGVSLKRLEMELMKKGVAKEVIEEALANSERSDVEEIKKIINKKRARYDDEKLVAYLCRHGFSYELVRELVRESGDGWAES